MPIEDQIRSAVLETLFEPLKRLVLVAESRVDFRKRVRGYVPLF